MKSCFITEKSSICNFPKIYLQPLIVGVCVPDSCNETDVETIVNECELLKIKLF